MNKLIFHILVMSSTGSSLYSIIRILQSIRGKKWNSRCQYQFFKWNFLFYLIPFTLGIEVIKWYQTFLKATNHSLFHFEKIRSIVFIKNFINLSDLKFRIFELLMIIWMIGVMIALIIQWKKEKELTQYIDGTSILIQNPTIRRQFEKAKHTAQYYDQIDCYENPYLKAPILLGTKDKKLVLPIEIKEEEAQYLVMLHEIMHAKRKDVNKRKMVQRLKAIFWFHPGVYFYTKTYNHWSELSCDEDVMKLISPKEQLYYIELVVQITSKNFYKKELQTVSFRGNDTQFEQRIQQMIRFYKKDFEPIKYLKEIFIFFILACLNVLFHLSFFAMIETYYLFEL